MKPLFLPLKKEDYRMFQTGEKANQLRKYGPRWNEKTCTIGREIILSLGYGKQERMRGIISGFRRQHGRTPRRQLQVDILALFGTLDIDIANIEIKTIRLIR